MLQKFWSLWNRIFHGCDHSWTSWSRQRYAKGRNLATNKPTLVAASWGRFQVRTCSKCRRLQARVGRSA